MLLKGKDVLENIDEVNLSRELEIAKFRNYGREHFADLIKHEFSFESFINHSSRFYSIRLPKEISDYLIRMDTAPFFWVSEAHIVKQIDDVLLSKTNEFNFVANHREVKKYFSKWVVQKTESDKQYFSQTIINLLERNFAFQSFYNLIIYGVILTFDKNAYNPSRAIEIYDRALELVSNSNMDAGISEMLLYYINVYKGFVYLGEFEYSNARNTYNRALKYNPHGVNAYFYIALSSRYLDDFDNAFEGLKNVLEYDRLRFQYAINFNQLKLFSFFYNGAFFCNVFTEMGFAQMLPDIDFLLRSYSSGEANIMEATYSKLINLDNLRIKKFFDDEVYKEVEFLKSALDIYKQKRKGLIKIVENIFRDKLVKLIEYIRNLIETHFFEQIKKEIIVFDKQIEQNKKQLESLKMEREEIYKKIKTTHLETTEYLKEAISEREKALEENIKSLEKSNEFNPAHVFSNSIVFSSVIAVVVFFVVISFSFFLGISQGDEGFKSNIMSGIKWGGIVFVFGIIISVFSSVSAFWEKNAEKKNLVTKLNYIKETNAQESHSLEEESGLKVKVYEQKFKDRMTSQEKIIEGFRQEREQNYKMKYLSAQKEIEELISPLNCLLNSLENIG